MSRILIQCSFLIIWFRLLNGNAYQDRPKLKTVDGDLILEAAYDKNIKILPNGPNSKVFVGNVNILSGPIKNDRDNEVVSDNDLERSIHGPAGILRRLDDLENKHTSLPEEYYMNISTLWRRINNINRRVSYIQVQVQNFLKDDCETNPCEHGGTCLNLLDGHHCLCPSNWEGKDCDVDVNECRNFAGTDLGCQNQATCINRPGSYECLCKSGWFGLHCTRKAKDCSGGDSEMCGHGKCLQVTTGEGITCLCDQGWTTNGTGVECSTDVNECDSRQGNACSVNPKVECINLPGSFRCGQCPTGFEGDGYTCSDIDECTISNGGCNSMVACQNTVGSRICGPCPPGYQGDGITCSWRGSCSMNYCHPSAKCIERTGGAQCNCPDGMDGDGIGIHGCYVSVANNNSSISCANNPCGTHGLCHMLRKGYTCICQKGYGGSHCDDANDVCGSLPCQNGGLCRLDDNSERGFRCECSAQYSGTFCQVLSKTCGGVLNSEEGNIVYPITNTTYRHNANCAWVIHTVPAKVINVTFSKFNLENHDECLYDFLQIHDGRSSVNLLIGRFCGNSLPNGGHIISTHNYLYLWFRSDPTVNKEGFALHWTSIKPTCGGEINASEHGQISSPGSPGKYPPNRDCYWQLTANYGKRIQIHFFALDIETHPNCSFDFLAIYDGMHTSDPLLVEYCNSTQPAPVQSSGSDILIHFHSDAYEAGTGFQLSYAPVEGIPGCGGYFTLDKGEIISPSFNGSYLNNMICEYKIKTSPETKIKLNFISFSLEHSVNCRFDNLKIYDGPTSDSPLVGKFCGISYPKTYTSSSNYVFIRFKSDYVASNVGFKISYQALCHFTLLGDSGIIKSPGYPLNYPANTVCYYIISTKPGKAIQLVFQDFSLEDNDVRGNCQYDHVEVRDGENGNATLLGKYCGNINHIPPVQTSTHNYMYIVFHSDISVSGSGFYANYTTIDTKCGGIFRTNPGLINFPSSQSKLYDNSQSCTWLIIAPEGMHIKLTWNRFEIEKMEKCVSDYLEIFEDDDNNDENNLGKYCGTNFPPALTTSNNRLKLIFRSDRSVRLSGFSVSYSFIDDNLHCGGVYSKTHGFIYSPGWPGKYHINKDCSWTISVPVGQQIRLNISQFDLEGSINNRCSRVDYLEIRNGLSEFSPLLGRYCGSFNSKLIKSTSNVLKIHFHSDLYLTGNGFKIEWDGSLLGCGGSLTSSTGSISSPNYPESYNENSECFYKITTNQGSRIRIAFSELELERAVHCSGDYIEIFDGKSPSTPSLGKHCFMSAALNNIETSTNYAFIKFRSDFSVTGKGFYLNYYTNCNTNLTGRYGVIESPDFPNNYPSSLNCLWNITVPVGNKIKVIFTHFDILHRYGFYHTRFLLNRSKCEIDYLQWKEPSEPTFTSKICGKTLPSMISTRTNSLEIKFVTNSFRPRTGFRLEWISEGCGGHIKKSSGLVAVNASVTSSGPIECEWLIETSVGKSIKLLITELYLLNTPNCTTDGVEIYNGQDAKTPLLTKICHRDPTPIVVMSTVNFMFIRFIKRSGLKGTHLASLFSSPPKTVGCGGRITSPSGFIYSQNYPKNYDNNLDCLWMIYAPYDNVRMELNFLDFDLYFPYENRNDCKDSIKIYDGDLLSSNYTHIVCPTTNVSKIITNNHHVIVQFTTDGIGSAKGFKIGYSIICGAQIKAKSDGIISNERYKGGSKSCTWFIVAAEPNQRISLTFTHIALPNQLAGNQSCSSSYIRVFDGDDDKAPQIGEFCGKKVPPMIISHGSAITVVLGTYDKEVKGLFAAHYSPVNAACGGTLSSEQGTIASPNYPRTYPNAIDCEWKLTTSPGNRVYVTFEQFSIEYSEGCNEDYLEIRENYEAGNLLGVYCGDEVPINVTAASLLYIKFHSNDKSRGKNLFLLHFEFLHGNNFINIDEGEITSPLYPYSYFGVGEYSWRIMVTGQDTITLSISTLEIDTHTEICNNRLSVYNGYDDTAPLLDELCGVLFETKYLQTSSNVAYIKLSLDETNTGAIFHMRWVKSDHIAREDGPDKINCGSNTTELVLSGGNLIIQSPNYPKEYDNNLNCEWVYQSASGQHLTLHFLDVELEERSFCESDFLSIYSSHNLVKWMPVKEHVCTSQPLLLNNIESSRYMKIRFKTDSSVTKKGFKGEIRSACGGYVTELSGVISPIGIARHYDFDQRKLKCNWTVKVRPGRVIKLRFIKFNITNQEARCDSSVTLHNGESIEAPLLSNGKYCGYSHENRIDITTSSNALFITYVNDMSKYIRDFGTFKIFYEEMNVECGLTSDLNSEHSWEIISSPNYPNIPEAYSECVWKFSAPPGEIIRIDFIGRFDLDYVDDCATEFVELRDGSSDLSPLITRSCGEKPQTTKTTGNMLRIKYSTQLVEPRNGFSANISLDFCGGTIFAESGEISSPDYPYSIFSQYNSACKWILKTSPRYVYQILPTDMDIPESETHCATKVTVQENNKANHTSTILRTFCSNEQNQNMSPIQTSSNEVIITLDIGKPSEWYDSSRRRGFRFDFNSSRQACGGTVKESEGYLVTPGYPLESSLRYCQWFIEVPDKTRRIRLELLDVENEKNSIAIYNDKDFQSIIYMKYGSSNFTNTRVFESSGNMMSIIIWLNAYSSKHKFKARFSSNEQALCGGNLHGRNGNILSPLELGRSYFCKWNYVAETTDYEDGDVIFPYNTVLMSLKLNSSFTKNKCRYTDPKLTIKSQPNNLGISIKHDYCSNTEASFRVPSSMLSLTAFTRSRDSDLNFNITWNAQPCGGTITASMESINILKIPGSYNGSLDCVWIVDRAFGTRLELKMEGTFQFGCDDEFVKISQEFAQQAPSIGTYCANKALDEPLTLNYRFISIEYHTKTPNNNTHIKLFAKLAKSQCGGSLNSYEYMFTSPNYPKTYESNQECSWIITASLGNRISLGFVDRFVIEDRPNCTKDALIIYDWNNNDFNEIARLCGRQTPNTYNSTFNKMKVVFKTDDTTNLDGFKALWKPICGGRYVASEKEHFIYSPEFPHNYHSMTDCTYTIVAPNKENVLVKFIEFELEGTYPNCQYDNVTITAHTFYDYYDSGAHCGSKMPSMISRFNKVTIHFMTDRYFQSKGFKLLYKTYNCNEQVKTPTIITSNTNKYYDSNMNCSWYIEAPPNKIVVLKFLYIDLENFDCINDYVAVFNDFSVDNDKRLALLCGHFNSTTVIRSQGEKVLLQFISDSSGNYKGFKVEVTFTYAESAGCGGQLDLTSSQPLKTLKSVVGNYSTYDSYLDCHWKISSPTDTIVKIQFTSFHIAPCINVNQTELGFSKCDCDYVEIKDGLNPDSLTIGTFCGHTIPPALFSSENMMSLRLSTDGEIESSGFEAKFSYMQNVCGKSQFRVTDKAQRLSSPSFDKGNVPRNLHCIYYFDPGDRLHSQYRISFISFGLQNATNHGNSSKCNKDKLEIINHPTPRNISVGRDYLINHNVEAFFSSGYYIEDNFPNRVELCGSSKPSDLYVTGSLAITLLTSSDSDSTKYVGFQIEVAFAGFCGQNFTDTQGKILSHYDYSISVGMYPDFNIKDCYTLITAPENSTISAYFISVSPVYMDELCFLDIYDGSDTTTTKLATVRSEYEQAPVFSTGRYMLLHNHRDNGEEIFYEMNYLTTDKGRGCGGKLLNEIGLVTSPMYPEIYRKQSTCEWQLETPYGTRLKLQFSAFDLGNICEQNYLQLVDRKGNVISTYCSETPAVYTSDDNYVKIVFITTVNNSGTGWVARFVGIV